MKRIVTLYDQNMDKAFVDDMACKLNIAFENDEYHSIMIGMDKRAVMQIIELEENGEYRCITISKKGIKIQKVPIETVSKW